MDKRKDNLLQTTSDSYREKIIEMVGQIEDEIMLIKIYTVVKTLKDIQIEKEGG